MDNPIRLVRELKGAPLSIVMVLMMVKQRVTQEFLQAATGYTDKPVAAALKYLQETGVVDHTSSGWLLLKGDHEQLPLPVTSIPNNVGADGHPPQGRNNSDPVVVVNLTNKDLNILTTTTDLTTDQVGEIPTLQMTEQIMRSIGEIFGKQLHGDPADYCDLDRLIACTAQAWSTRGEGKGKLRNPVGFIYWAFHQGTDKHPDKIYRDIPERYLPEEFINTCGYWEPEE
jgi:hypothetical protein